MYTAGDKAVYPAHGVVEVQGIAQKEICGKVHQFYELRVVDSDLRVLVPTDKCEQVGMRPLAGPQDVAAIYDLLREREPMDKQTWNRRHRALMEKVKTGSLFEVAEVCRDLYHLGETKTLAFGERKMRDTARHLLTQELAIATGTSQANAQRHVDLILAGGRRANAPVVDV